MQVSWGRFIATFLIGFVITSNLNWAVAELVLNPWAMPRFDGFMRTAEDGANALSILRMTLGFMLPLLVCAILMATLTRPADWFRRGLWVGSLVSVASFFGAYTFISGWGRVPWWPLMVTAVCDLVTILVGTVLIGYLQSRGWRPAD